MVTMAYNIDGIDYLTIPEAVDFMGCTDGWVRALCRDGRLASRMLGKRLRLVEKRSAAEVRDSLSTRAKGKKHLAKRPAAKRKTAKRKK
ncbi:MAG: DNA-binding protein [Proteobacteria bacterium]|nr:DNA-binding protein [Pseudomonadota bacterium]